MGLDALLVERVVDRCMQVGHVLDRRQPDVDRAEKIADLLVLFEALAVVVHIIILVSIAPQGVVGGLILIVPLVLVGRGGVGGTRMTFALTLLASSTRSRPRSPFACRHCGGSN